MDAESAGPVAGKRALTVCAYICGDTGKVTGDIEEELIEDLHEMMVAGATPDMAILVQLDKGSNGQCTRFILAEKSGYATLAGEEDIGPVNMGAVSTLVAFLDWCMETRPAENYALIVGSHGSGPKADPIYRTVAENAQVGAERAIAFDDGSRSFLSIPDLRRALEHGVKVAGKPFAVVVFDACYMASFEVLHELQGLADYVVASPEAVPGEGMPYSALLMEWGLLKKDGDFAADLAGEAVDEFMSYYQWTDETASLLAVDMAKVHVLSLCMNILGNVLLLGERAAPMVADTIAKVPRTSDPNFVYLYPLCYDLVHALHMPKAITDSAQDVCRAIQDAVAASWQNGMAEWGPTVYLPRGPVPSWYKALDVAKTAWGEWVQQL